MTVFLHHCSDFITKLDPAYGNCFTFNGDIKKIKHSFREGKTDGACVRQKVKTKDMKCNKKIEGLRLLLNTRQMEYLNFVTQSGFIVTVHQNGMPAFPLDFGLNIPVGYFSAIGVQMVQIFISIFGNTVNTFPSRLISANYRHHTVNVL